MSIKRANIIIPPVWSGVFYNTARLLKYSLEENGIKSDIREADDINNTDFSIVLGWNLMTKNISFKQPYIIYQLEPLCLEHWRQNLNSRLSLFEHAFAIWDYSSQNQKYLEAYGLKSQVIPLGYHPKLQEIEPEEYADFDVLFVGFLTERRQKILEELNNHCCVSVQPRWGTDFRKALGRSKILLNIHQYDIATPLEQPRIAYALNNKCFVLSEESLDNPYEHLMTCTYENLATQILHFLHQPKLRNEVKNQVFESFKQFCMKDMIATYIEM
jgi:hypothetical protein